MSELKNNISSVPHIISCTRDLINGLNMMPSNLREIWKAHNKDLIAELNQYLNPPVDNLLQDNILPILIEASSGSEGLKTFAAIALQAMDSEVDAMAGAYGAERERDDWRELFNKLIKG